jgi:ankyrin repeat protein
MLFNMTIRSHHTSHASMLSSVKALFVTCLLLAITSSFAAEKSATLVELIRSGELLRTDKRTSVLASIAAGEMDVNAKTPDGSTALMWAAYSLDHELVRALLKARAKANVVNHYGSSALSESIKLVDLELVRMLLDAGADVNSPNLDNQTALMLSISMGVSAQKISELLIQRGADINAIETFRGQNALMYAAAGNQPDVVDQLIARGGQRLKKEINMRAKHDDWPRQMTSEPRAQFGTRQTGGLTALLYATRSGCYRCAVALVKAGAEIEKPNPDGVTPLINALDNRAFDIAMFLLDQGANPHTWDMSGRTPLYVAVDMNSFTGTGGFGFGPPGPAGFDGLAPANARATSSVTAMNVVERLLTMGVDTNHELTRKRPYGPGRGRFADYMMRGGTGPVMLAAMSHDHVALKALLDKGAEPDIPNAFRITPLMAAANLSGSGRGGICTGAGGGPAGAGAAAGGVTESKNQTRAIKTIDLLLDAGANVNGRVTQSRTRTAKLDSYVQGCNHEGKTALFSAAEAGLDKVVKHLLDRGADPSLRDAAGKTALDYARVPRVPAAGSAPGGADGIAATVAMLSARIEKSAATREATTSSATSK